MKMSIMMIFGLIIVSVISSQDTVRVQKFSVTNVSGSVEYWSSKESRWITYQKSSELTATSTIATRNAASMQMTFEPAIVLNVKENSVFKLNNLQIHSDKKMIRMMITLQTGEFELKTTGLQNSTLLLTLTTPSAIISVNDAECSIRVSNDSTAVQVRKGEVKVENSSSAIKSVVATGYKAATTSSKPDVIVTSLNVFGQEAKRPLKQPSIAILSIQANGVNRENVSHVANYVAEQYQEVSAGSRVLFLDDIREMLRIEQSERLLDCFSDSCIAKIGNVLGVDLVIIGNLGQLGKNYMFSLKMIDVLRDVTVSRITKTVESDVGLILKEIPGMVNNLALVQDKAEQVKTDQLKKTSGVVADFEEKKVWINGGEFKMGVDFDGKTFDAVPQHTVTVRGFYMDKYEVTREEFQTVMGFNPSTFRGCDRCPVENVTWNEALEYCKKSDKRLPTEAEWEYAGRAGTTTKFHYGDVLSGEQANFDSRYPFGGVPASSPRNRPIPVGEYDHNTWGLHDMHGNVAEWCSDWYDAAYYGNSPAANPQGPAEGKLKVVRGGAWNSAATSLLSGKRVAYNPEIRLPSIGFRCVKDDYGRKK